MHKDDKYIVVYEAGGLGDFLSSILCYSFYIETNSQMPYDRVDSFTYSPWSKKWVFRDSSAGYLRNYIYKIKEIKTLSFLSRIQCIQSLNEEFNLKQRFIGTPHELDHLLSIFSIHRDNYSIPYIYTCESFDALKFMVPQMLDDYYCLHIGFFEKRYKFLYYLLRTYKNVLHTNKVDSKEFYVNNYNEFFGKLHPDRLDVYLKIKQARKIIKVDMLELILNNNTQGLDQIKINNQQIKNMISTAKYDVLEILDYFGYSLDTETFGLEEVNNVYEKLVALVR